MFSKTRTFLTIFKKHRLFFLKTTAFSTVDPKEVKTFSKVSDWWDFSGSQQALQAYNLLRTDYIKQILHSEFKIDPSIRRPLKGLEVLDVGSGGGLLCESLARFGANVTGIDPTENSIKVSSEHAKRDPTLSENLKYIQTTSDEFFKTENKKFDLVTSMEVFEHVSDPDSFLRSLAVLLKPNGVLIMSTFNKTYKSYIFGVCVAEYILRLVPKGTHDWEKFINPMDLISRCERTGLELIHLQGAEYDLLKNEMKYSKNLDINYLVSFRRKKERKPEEK